MPPTEHTQPTPAPARWFYPAAAAIVALSVIPRLPFLTESIWYDEFLRTRFWLGGDRFINLAFYDVHNPLYNLLMWAWTRLFGDSEVSIRIPSMLAAYSATILFAWWTRRRVGDGVALTVLAWCLLSPVHIWHSTEAKNHVFCVFFATWTLVAYDLLREAPTRRRLAFAAAASTLGIYTDFLTLLATVPVWMAAWRSADAAARRAIGRAMLITLLAAAPLLAFKALHTAGLARAYAHYFSFRQLLLLLANYFANGNTLLPDLAVRRWLIYSSAPIIFGLLALGMARLQRRGLGTVNAAFVLPLLFMLIASAVIDVVYDDNSHYIYQERNLLVLFHPYALVLIAGAWTIPWRGLRAAVVAVLIGANITGSVLMHTIYADIWTVADPNPDYRATARHIEAIALQRGSPVLLVDRTRLAPFEYYTKAAVLHAFPSGPIDPAALRALITGPGQGEAYWFHTPNADALTPEELAALRDGFLVEQVFTARAVTLYRVTPRK